MTQSLLDFDNIKPGRRWHTPEQLFEMGLLSRRTLWKMAAAAPFILMFPRTSLAATNFLWEGAGSYGVGVANILTTELNSLASSSGNTLSTLGAAFQNTTGRLFSDGEFVAGGTLSPVAGAFGELWYLQSIDGGTNYEDGTASIAPGRFADLTIPVRAGTTITPRAGWSKWELAPSFMKPIFRNQLGVSLPAASNLVRHALYTIQY